MPVYPDVITEVRSRIPLQMVLETRTLTSRFETEAQEKRRQKWTVPRRRVSLIYEFMTPIEIRTLWQFWLDRKGAFEAFTFFFPNTDNYIRQFVGVAEGGETHLRLPSRKADLTTVPATFSLWRNGALLTNLTEYLVQPEGGPDGEDYAALYITVEAGDRFEWTFIGELAMQMRFESNDQELELIKAHGSGTLVLQELVHKLGDY